MDTDPDPDHTGKILQLKTKIPIFGSKIAMYRTVFIHIQVIGEVTITSL
jgi:hypothetical protein